MAQVTQRRPRSDGVENREKLLTAARKVFAEQGVDAPLEEVARAASVSRTTLYRHFTTREQLAAEVFEHNVLLVEQRARELRGTPRAAVALLDYVLDMQESNRSLTQLLRSANLEWFGALSGRTEEAFRPLVEDGHRAGTVRPDVDVHDLIVALPMAGSLLTGPSTAARGENMRRSRILLHRALFI